MKIVYAITSKDFEPKDLMPKRRCPYCKELINYNALKCKYCKSDIKPLPSSTKEKYDNLYKKRIKRRRIITKIILILSLVLMVILLYWIYSLEKGAYR